MDTNLAYQDERREELMDGCLVAMSPRPTLNHNFIASNIYTIFANFLKGKDCVPVADGTDLYLMKTNRFVPDVMIVCDKEKLKYDGVYGTPDLVVEVLSPSTTRYDRGRKKDIYEQCGVREYWIVDPASRTVEQYFLENDRFELHDVYTKYPDYVLIDMTEEERAGIVLEFQCSLYDDLVIRVEDIFYRAIF